MKYMSPNDRDPLDALDKALCEIGEGLKAIGIIASQSGPPDADQIAAIEYVRVSLSNYMNDANKAVEALQEAQKGGTP